MFDWILKRKSNAQPGERPSVRIYLNPLHSMLHAAEKRKGSPLTEDEVIQVRETTVAIDMTKENAERFYASLDAQVQIYRMNPDRIWEEWQEIREHIF